MFRLNVDFPLGEDETQAAKVSEYLIGVIKFALLCEKEKTSDNEYLQKYNLQELLMQYRMSKDEDRTVRNYLVKDENGHVIKAKSQFKL